MLPDFEDLYKALKRDCYVNVPFPISRDILDESIQAFFQFLNEENDIKNHIDFSIAPLHRRGDIGFKHRDPGDHIYNDNKDFFHFHPTIFDQCGDFLKEHPMVMDFMEKAQPIWDATYHVVSGILNAFEPSFPGVHGKIFDTTCPHVMLRFLKYEWNESAKYLAKPHFDAGSFTLAIAESCPGLRIGSSPETLKLVDHREGNAVFMLSSNVEKVMDSKDLKPGWHDVIQLDDSVIGKPFARWAIVAFIEAHGVEALSRSETHKWYKGEAA